MNQPLVCPYCGLELPTQAPEGLCPNCLLSLGAAELGIVADAQSPESEDGGQKTKVSGQRFGNYEMLGKIAQGGMGVVYKARQLNLDRIVAVKLLPFGQFSREEAVQRFQAEAATAAGLQHPNIVAIHEVGEHEGQHFFSMDFVEGRTLAELVQAQPLTAKRAASYLKTIAEAVHYAHQHGILHRDLKPSNILIDAADQPRITDFGLAKRLSADSDMTLTGHVLGSPNFMSPEQAGGRHREVGPASDIYALGGLLYHLLTRQPPFQADTVTTLLKQVIEIEPISPRLLNPSVPRDLETICLKCLEKSSSRRYSTAQALAEELGRFLEGKPIEARPVSAAGKAWKWSRRRPVLVGMGAALVLTFLLGLVGVLWQWSRAGQIAQAELRQRVRAEADERFARLNTYAADMHLAQLALADNNRTLAAGLLDKYRPAAGGKSELDNPKSESDLRGWEWRYLWQLSQGDELFMLHRYTNGINALAVSKDGALLAVGTGNGVAVWDLKSRQPLASLSRGSTPALAFSPSDNLLAVAAWNGAGRPVVELWNVNAARITRTLLCDGRVQSLGFSPDGRLLATFDIRGKVRITDVASNENDSEFDVPPTRYGDAGAVVFTPDGRRLGIGEDYGRLRVLDLRAKSFARFETQTSAGIVAVAFSRNSELMAASFGYVEGTIRLWNTRTGELRGELTNHTANVKALAFTPDGRQLVSASQDGTIRIWNTADHSEVRCLRSSCEGLNAMALLPDSRTLVSGGSGGSLCFWDMAGSRRGPVHTNLTISLGFEAFVGLAPSDFEQKTLNPRVVRRFGVAFTPDSRSFITMDSGGALGRWDARSLRHIEDLPAFGSNHWAVALSPDGHWLASGDFPGTITLWDCRTQHSVTNFAVPFEWLGFLKFSRSGRFFFSRLLFNDYRCDVRLWRTGDWSEVSLTASQSAGLWAVDFSPDDRLLAGGYLDGTVKLFRFPSGEPETTFTHHPLVAWVQFSPDGQVLCSTSFDSTVVLWDVLARRPLETLSGHVGMALGCAFSPDGHRLATGGSTVRDAAKLWDLATHRELLSLQGEGKWYLHLAFSPDGNTLVATALSGCTEVWHAPSWEEIETAEQAREASLR